MQCQGKRSRTKQLRLLFQTVPHDLLLGRDNRLLSPLLRQALPDEDVKSVLKDIEQECQVWQQQELAIAAVTTRAAVKAQQKKNLDENFPHDLDDSLFNNQGPKTKSPRNKNEKTVLEQYSSLAINYQPMENNSW